MLHHLYVHRYGVRQIHKMCQILNSLPSSITQLQTIHYFSSFTGIVDNAAMIISAIQQSALLPPLQQELSVPKILAPPTSKCLKCSKGLVQNHSCSVVVYTMNGILHTEKVTLRCTGCRLYYNYDKWGNKRNCGFLFYSSMRELVEVNDATYFQRQLLEFQCSLA